MATGASFTAAVSAITDAFGDPTRRSVYLYVRDDGGDDGLTTSAVASEVGSDVHALSADAALTARS
jgi:hypothetical protein